jgi:hypothetical protein
MNYFSKLLLISIILATAFYTFILSVDPYEKFGFNVWHLKTKAVYSDRDMKFYHINQPKNQYDFFVLGSSRAQYIDPDQIDNLTHHKSYNYSVITGQPEDYLVITRHIIDKQKPKAILLYLDFKNLNAFNKKTKQFTDAKLLKYFDQNTRLEEKKESLLFAKSYMTLTALTDSIKIIFTNAFGDTAPVIKSNGMYARDHGPLYHIPKLEMSYFDEYYVDYSIDKERVFYLTEIKKLCEIHNIKLVVCISPVSKEHLDKILVNNNLRKNFFEFKRVVTSTFGEVHDFNNYAISKYDGYYWVDSVHITKEFANIIIDRALSDKKQNEMFGYVLKKENIEFYINNFDASKIKQQHD